MSDKEAVEQNIVQSLHLLFLFELKGKVATKIFLKVSYLVNGYVYLPSYICYNSLLVLQNFTTARKNGKIFRSLGKQNRLCI